MTPIQKVLSHLSNYRESGPKKWMAPCPTHDDRNPSLSIAERADGCVLIKCHAGCETSAVVSALDLTLSDLFPNNSQANTNANANGKQTKTFPTSASAIHALERKLGKHSTNWTYTDAAGKPVGCIVRWDYPDRKVIRPVSPNGDGTWRIGGMPEPRPLYRLPDLASAQRVYVCEGEKCVDLARALGLTATTSPHGSKSAAKADWRPVAGKEVVVLPDNDDAGTKYANTVAAILARLEPTPTVKVLRLPGLPSGGDIEDWLDSKSEAAEPDALREEIEAMLDVAPVYKPATTAEKGLAPIEASDDPHRLARHYIIERCQHAEGLTLRFWREEWHRWDGSAYRIVPEKELRAELTVAAKGELDRRNVIDQELGDDEKAPPVVRKVTGRLIADVAHALASLTIVPSRIEAPAWLEGNGPFPAPEILTCRNGLIHLPSLVIGKQHFTPPTPRFFSVNCLDIDFSLQAPEPAAWLTFLRELWPEDPQSIATLQAWFGYLLTPDTRQQKILLLVGPKRSGKGTIARVLRALLGAGNVACPTLSSLATNFGLWPLLGKTVAMIQDARLSGRSDIAAVVERLLSISGEDAQTIDRKNLQPVTAKLFSRFMLLTNELPKLNDASEALPGRMILLQLTHSWYGNEDTTLTDRLLGELPGILLWAIAGWQQLCERGHFVQPDASKAMVGELADLASPVGAFVRERCQIGPGFQIERTVLFHCWKQWCEEQGRAHPGDAATFGRNLRAAVPSIGDTQPRTDSGERIRVYQGIGSK